MGLRDVVLSLAVTGIATIACSGHAKPPLQVNSFCYDSPNKLTIKTPLGYRLRVTIVDDLKRVVGSATTYNKETIIFWADRSKYTIRFEFYETGIQSRKHKAPVLTTEATLHPENCRDAKL